MHKLWNRNTSECASTLKDLAINKVNEDKFGCNRRRTREKTQASKEKVAKEDPEKAWSLVTRIDWNLRKNPEVKIHQAFRQILSKVWLN